MTFHIVNHKESVIISCATRIILNLIQIHSELNSRVPDCGKLIYSCADDPDKYRYKIKSNVNMCNKATASAREVQPPEKPKEFKTEVTQWKNKVVQEENKQQQKCQA